MFCDDITDKNTSPRDKHLKNGHKLEKKMEHDRKITLTTHQTKLNLQQEYIGKKIHICINTQKHLFIHMYICTYI